VQNGAAAGAGPVDLLTAAIAAALVIQTVLTRFGALAGARLGEGLLARLREDFVDQVLALPLSVVERAGSGDLLTRSSRDVAALSRTARTALPAILTASLSAVLTLGAIGLDSPVLLLPCILVVPVVWPVTRWYLRRAGDGYLRENAAWAQLTESLAETVSGARTVDALSLGPARRRSGCGRWWRGGAVGRGGRQRTGVALWCGCCGHGTASSGVGSGLLRRWPTPLRTRACPRPSAAASRRPAFRLLLKGKTSNLFPENII